MVVFLGGNLRGVTCISDKPKKHSSICTHICIYIYIYCQTHLVCAFWSIMLLRRPRMFRHMPLPFLSHSGGRERSHGGCGTKQQSRVFAGALESNLKGLRFTLVAEPLRRRPVRVFFQSWNRNGVSSG